MPATNKFDLSTSTALLYLAPYNSSAVITELNATHSNAGTVYTDIKTAYPVGVHKRVASIKDTQLAENFADGLTELVVDDGNGLIYSSSTPSCQLSTTWHESKNDDVRAIITGFTSVSVTESTVTYDVSGYKRKVGEIPRFCAIILATRSDGKVEEFYMTDCTLGGDVVTAFSKEDTGEPTGSSLTITLNRGGVFLRKIPA